MVDGIPHSESDKTDRYISNVMCVTFDNLQSGYLAGYIAVKNGNTKLGYFGQYNSDDSANYGAGFAQGAAAAANELGVPVTLDWADYDSPLLNYNYGFTLTACYKKTSEVKNKEVFTVKVENGIGSGTYKEGSNVTVTADPAPKGKVFDKWVTKSNTDGVKDKKVNISSKTKSSMNLLVEKCDCTITATYKDAEGAQYDVQVLGADGKSVYSQQYVSENTSVDITAPAPITPYTVFDHWETDDKDAVEDVNSRTTKVNVTNKDVKLVPVYKQSDTPTFEVKVVTGEGGNGESTGDGYYVEGDKVELSAAVPKEGYMFSHWENKDSYGVGAGIAIENEYYWNTSFDLQAAMIRKNRLIRLSISLIQAQALLRQEHLTMTRLTLLLKITARLFRIALRISTAVLLLRLTAQQTAFMLTVLQTAQMKKKQLRKVLIMFIKHLQTAKSHRHVVRAAQAMNFVNRLARKNFQTASLLTAGL